MNSFLAKIKEFMIDNSKNGDFDACEYYSTLDQHQNKLQMIIDDCENYEYYFRYTPDDSGGYTEGKIGLYFQPYQQATYHYEIELLHDERYWGYCQCTPEDEGYDPVANCCGTGCDWVAPRINIVKIDNIAWFSFDGYEKDLWELQAKWKQSENDVEDKHKQEQINYIDNQIAELIKRKNMIIGD